MNDAATCQTKQNLEHCFCNLVITFHKLQTAEENVFVYIFAKISFSLKNGYLSKTTWC